MTVQECYDRMGADYGDVLRRLGNEERVKRFLCRLPQDPSYGNLCGALQEGNAEEAFRAVHSLKGICMNLSLTTLFESANALTEELRARKITPAAEPLAERVGKDYQEAVRWIQELL